MQAIAARMNLATQRPSGRASRVVAKAGYVLFLVARARRVRTGRSSSLSPEFVSSPGAPQFLRSHTRMNTDE
ncbi:MAG: hypothetical protein ABGY24_12305 [bacterium]